MQVLVLFCCNIKINLFDFWWCFIGVLQFKSKLILKALLYHVLITMVFYEAIKVKVKTVCSVRSKNISLMY